MGYSVATRIKPLLLKPMLDFLEAEWRRPQIVFGDEYQYISDPTTDLDYDHGKSSIGFNYNDVLYQREYAHATCRWIAIEAGRKRKWKELPVAVPHYVYDGYHAVPVIPNPDFSVPEKFKWAITDANGYRESNDTTRCRRQLAEVMAMPEATEEQKVGYQELLDESLRWDGQPHQDRD